MVLRNYFLIVLVLTLTKPGLTYGQDINIKIGFRDSIKSEILHESRKILIHLPDGYDTSKQSYTVLYRLDGNPSSLFRTVAVANRLVDIQKIIIVAIENVNRDRDMMPVKSNYYSGTIGGEKFLDFIETELIPVIESKYRTNHKRILCGHVGGAKLTKDFIRSKLADEIRQSILPILLGNGTPFYDQIGQEEILHLKNVTAYKSGMVELCYEIKK